MAKEVRFNADRASEVLTAIGVDFATISFLDVMPEIARVINQSTRDNFNSSADPDGGSWPPRKHIGDGHPLLMDTGKLLQAATGGGSGHIERMEPNGIVVGVDGATVPYAGIHNDGMGGRMPQREYLGLDEEGQNVTEDILIDFLMSEVF